MLLIQISIAIGILLVALIIAGRVAVTKWIIRYGAQEIAKEIRRNNGELARAIAYELAQLEDQPAEEE